MRFRALNKGWANHRLVYIQQINTTNVGRGMTAPYRILFELNVILVMRAGGIIIINIFTCKSAKIRTGQKKMYPCWQSCVLYQVDLFEAIARVFSRQTGCSRQCVVSVFFHDSVQTG